ncbi:MAG: methyl-accepting chemotaxis protein [Helicobacter sp.]|uniref:methyl-accepting chemotaxis protein n=2 Tax=Helicobacter sp. TaxID=218 RepID=UPI003751398E|nr:methyl-accepting chemotaxis protein [Helicobacter sp.]
MKKWFGSLSIATKLLTSVASIVLIGIIVLAFAVLNEVRENILTNTRNTITQASKNYATMMKAFFDETVILTRGVGSSLNKIYQQNAKDVKISVLGNIMENMLDNSRASYSFLWLLQRPDDANLDKRHFTESGKFVMLYHSPNEERNTTYIEQAHDILIESPVIQRVLKESKNGKQQAYVGEPAKINFGYGEFLGLNIAYPIFDKEKNLVGVVGYTFNLLEVSHRLTDPALSLYKGDFRILLKDSGVITIHEDPKLILSNIRDVNTHPEAKEVLDAVFAHQSGVFDNYITTGGEPSYASVESFRTINTNDPSYWSILVTAPKSEVLKPLYQLQMYVALLSIGFLIIVMVAVWYFVRKIVGARLPVILDTLISFFRLLNHEKVQVKPIAIHSNDELGAMGRAINENIQRAQSDLQQDSALVNESLDVINHTREGYADRRITLNGANPQLNTLKDSVNQLLDLLSSAIGNDLPELNRVFDSFVKLDFSTQVKDAKGRVEVVTNTLGEEIRQMLQASSNFAKDLAAQSEELKTSMQKLTEGSQSQASSLEQSAAAVEEISSSMQNVSDKTIEATKQAEDIKNIVGVIKDIADQTNLLALNAAIEAARAGEHGRGFAVVADEVRKLAEKTTKSLGEIEANVNILVQSSNEVAESILEQTESLHQINISISQLETQTQQNVEIAHTTNDITQEVNVIATEILDDVKKKKF